MSARRRAGEDGGPLREFPCVGEDRRDQLDQVADLLQPLVEPRVTEWVLGCVRQPEVPIVWKPKHAERA